MRGHSLKLATLGSLEPPSCRHLEGPEGLPRAARRLFQFLAELPRAEGGPQGPEGRPPVGPEARAALGAVRRGGWRSLRAGLELYPQMWPGEEALVGAGNEGWIVGRGFRQWK